MGNCGLRKSIQNEQWTNVRTLIQKEDVQQRIRIKQYPDFEKEEEMVHALHLVLQRNVPFDILQAIVILDPTALGAKSSVRNEIPLHYAIRYMKRQRPEIIQRLVEWFPQGTIVRSKYEGYTPLHYACANLCSLEMILALLVQNTTDSIEAVDITDFYGNTPWNLIDQKTRYRPWKYWYRRSVYNALIGHATHGAERREQQLNNDETGSLQQRRSPNPPPPILAQNVQIDEATSFRGGGMNDIPIAVPIVNGYNNNNDYSGGIIGSGYYPEPSAPVETMMDEDVDASEVGSGTGTGLCVICWDGMADHVVIPCGHVCLCTRCATTPIRLATLQGKCPICAQYYNQLPIRIYHSGIDTTR